MSICVPENVKKVIDDRQRAKYEAIRKEPIYDAQVYIPTGRTEIRCLAYHPAGVSPKTALPVVFDMHGGGFTNGYPEEDDLICRKLSDTLRIRVFSIEYGLAPEHPYPEGQMDCYSVITYIHDHAEEFGILGDQMVVVGHSAGGNMAANMIIRSIEEKNFTFKGGTLDYPPLDFVTSGWDKPILEGAVPPELSEIFDSCYSLPEQRGDHHVSPLYTPDEILREFPPMTIITAEIDSLREEAEEFGLRLIRNGVEVTMKRFPNVCHAFTIDYQNPTSQDAYRMIESCVRRSIGC